MLLFSRLKASQATYVALLAPNDATQAGDQINNVKIGCFLTPWAPNHQETAPAPLLGWKGAAGILGLAICASNNLSISGDTEVKRR